VAILELENRMNARPGVRERRAVRYEAPSEHSTMPDHVHKHWSTQVTTILLARVRSAGKEGCGVANSKVEDAPTA